MTAVSIASLAMDTIELHRSSSAWAASWASVNDYFPTFYHDASHKGSSKAPLKSGDASSRFRDTLAQTSFNRVSDSNVSVSQLQ
jgi:hypothetical protein